jgi:hypothetical protein
MASIPLTIESKMSLINHYDRLGIERSISIPIITIFQKWLSCNGGEWTVDRIKFLKQALINKAARLPVDLTNVKHRGDRPSGPFKSLFNSLDNPKRIRRALDLLMIYSSIKVAKPVWLPKQFEKAYKAITTGEPTSIDQQRAEHRDMFIAGFRNFC